jgi:hypothetical protein
MLSASSLPSGHRCSAVGHRQTREQFPDRRYRRYDRESEALFILGGASLGANGTRSPGPSVKAERQSFSSTRWVCSLDWWGQSGACWWPLSDEASAHDNEIVVGERLLNERWTEGVGEQESLHGVTPKRLVLRSFAMVHHYPPVRPVNPFMGVE